MKLKPNEAVALIIHRDGGEPPNYLVTIRKGEARFDGAHDFRFTHFQESVLNLQHEKDLHTAIEQAISAIREIGP